MSGSTPVQSISLPGPVGGVITGAGNALGAAGNAAGNVVSGAVSAGQGLVTGTGFGTIPFSNVFGVQQAGGAVGDIVGGGIATGFGRLFAGIVGPAFSGVWKQVSKYVVLLMLGILALVLIVETAKPGGTGDVVRATVA